MVMKPDLRHMPKREQARWGLGWVIMFLSGFALGVLAGILWHL